MSPASVTIDAGVLVAPHHSDTAEDAYRYVETLLDWSTLLDQPWMAIYMSERASEALFNDGLYPLRNQLTRLFEVNGIVDYSVNDVAQVVNRLLQLTPHFETYFKVQEVLADNITTIPDILQSARGLQLQSDLARCVVLIAILREHCRNPILEHSLILRQAPGRIVNVRALIHELEHERNDLNAIPAPPEIFEGNVLACDDFRGLIECLDESAMLLSSRDDVGIETAIRVALYKSRLARQLEPDWDDIRGLRIGHHFHEIATSICRGLSESFPGRVLRAIVETLEDINLAAVHSLRTGPGGGNPQRMRGKDKAMRRDVDREYHLHYWQCQGGIVELASIVVHNDFSIPE